MDEDEDGIQLVNVIIVDRVLCDSRKLNDMCENIKYN